MQYFDKPWNFDFIGQDSARTLFTYSKLKFHFEFINNPNSFFTSF